MKQLIAAGLIGLFVVANTGADETPAPNRIGLVNVGGFHEPTMGRIAGYLATQLKSSPKMLAARDLVESADLRIQAKALGPLVTGDVICVIGIATMPEVVGQRGAISPTDRCAVLNATALKPAGGDEETYGRRLESETMRCAGLLLGMKPCPNPRCALFPYKDQAELERKGRNFCPPCFAHFLSRRTENQLHVREEDGTN